jgi:phenylalanyl-tRNA synthetase beta subunit
VSLRQVGLGQFEETIPSLSQICKGLLLSQRHKQKAKRTLQKMDLKEVEKTSYIQNLKIHEVAEKTPQQQLKVT